MNCDGACESHIGQIRQVRVTHIASGKDWGIFNYCESAIAEDISRGMEIFYIPIEDYVPSGKIGDYIDE